MMSKPSRGVRVRPALRRLLFAALGLGVLSGCTPQIGDQCSLSTDCSVQGNLLCDTSQPGGYCTSLNCQGNDCLDQATCVVFTGAVPGCAYNDRTAPGRSSRSICLKWCHSNSDCRTDQGYICTDPRQPPWGALILDNDQTQLVCILPPNKSAVGDASTVDAPVCQAQGPTVPPIEAGTTYPPPDAGGGGGDAAVASDVAGADGVADAGAEDAPGEGG